MYVKPLLTHNYYIVNCVISTGLDMPRRKVTPEIVGAMKKLVRRGLTYQDIAEKTGLPRPTVAEYLRKGKLEGKTAGSLEKLMVKMKKWEPVHEKVLQDEVSISKTGIDIFTWATGHFRGHKEVDLYIDDKGKLLGIKPAANGQRSLVPKAKGRGFSVVCTPLMKQIGVHERKRVPAEWSEKGKMLFVDLRGYRKASASTKLKSGA